MSYLRRDVAGFRLFVGGMVLFLKTRVLFSLAHAGRNA